MDPATHITINGLKARTSVCSNGAKEPIWNQTLLFPNIPSHAINARVEVYDIGMISDRLIAWADLDIRYVECQ